MKDCEKCLRRFLQPSGLFIFELPMKSRCILLFCLTLFSFSEGMAQVRFYASAPKQIAVNQTLQVSFTVENGQGKNLKPPSFEGFQILYGPNTSSQVQIVNGSMSQSVTYTYALRPQKEGVFKIGRASIQVSGAQLESNELSVEVTKAAAQQPQARRQPNVWDPFDDPFFRDPMEDLLEQDRQSQSGAQDLKKQLNDNVFTRMEVSRSELFEGEALTATLKLYFRTNISNLNLSKAPVFNGFWTQEIELPKDQKPREEVLNGQRYNVFDVQKFNLYPQKSGKLSITETEVQTLVLVQTGRGFFSRAEQLRHDCKTAPVSIQVKSIPTAGRPASYAGAVGRFQMTAQLSSTKARTDDAITFSVKISGEGNMKLIEAPKVELPESFEVFDPKVKEQIVNSPGGMKGFKQFDFLIIPRMPGKYTLPAQSFAYFDPERKQFTEEKTPVYELEISGQPSTVSAQPSTSTTPTQDVKDMGGDIRFIKIKPDTSSSLLSWSTPALIGWYVSPVLLFTGLLVYRRRNEHLAADPAGIKRRRATRMARRRLQQAEAFLKQNQQPAFYNEVSRALWGYLGDKLVMDTADLTKDNVSDKLSTRGVSANRSAELLHLLAQCDLALYARSEEQHAPRQSYETAVSLISQLEEEIR